jgi:type VI protein secretion system component VasK
MVDVLWFMVNGFMVYGVWCMVYGVWCMVYGVWCMVCKVYGLWFMVYGVWCMVYGLRFMMDSGFRIQGFGFTSAVRSPSRLSSSARKNPSSQDLHLPRGTKKSLTNI